MSFTDTSEANENSQENLFPPAGGTQSAELEGQTLPHDLESNSDIDMDPLEEPPGFFDEFMLGCFMKLPYKKHRYIKKLLDQQCVEGDGPRKHKRRWTATACPGTDHVINAQAATFEWVLPNVLRATAPPKVYIKHAMAFEIV